MFQEQVNNFTFDPNLCIDDSGIDSRVYSLGQHVAKCYSGRLSKEQIFNYANLTNRLCVASESQNWRINFDGPYQTLSVRVVPVIDIVTHEEGLVAIAPRIRGSQCHYHKMDLYFWHPLKKLSENICKSLGIDGVEIIPYNAKYVPEKNTLFITDLCRSISMLTIYDCFRHSFLPPQSP